MALRGTAYGPWGTTNGTEGSCYTEQQQGRAGEGLYAAQALYTVSPNCQVSSAL